MTRPTTTVRSIRTRRALGGVVALAAAASLLTACSSSKGNPLATAPATDTASGTVTVGSAAFPENALLAEIYAEVLEAKGVKVTRKFNVGVRDVLYKQLKSGAITLVPEYNGALLSYLDKSATQVDEAGVDAAVAGKLDPSLEILTSAAAEDKDSLTVTAATAGKYNLTKIEDLAPIAGSLVIGAAPEFQSRQQGLLGLAAAPPAGYGLKFKDFKPLDNSGALTISALQHGNIQVADIYTTDPSVAANGFVSLTDDLHLFGAQNVTPLAYRAGLTPSDADAIDAVSAKLDTPTLADLVKQIVSDKKDPDVVAKAWLRKVGLVS